MPEMNLNKQRGMTFLGWLIVLAIIGFFALLTIKIVPVYLENYTIKSVLESLNEEPLITQKTSREVKAMVMRRIDINGVRDIKSEHVIVKKSPGLMDVKIQYTVQKNMMGNLDILVNFSDEVRLVGN
ncbi:MAG: DUF4845 domain-containing protein [Chromatiales bacterium]|nr:DUF4845 domain-containing protein [Chromatiales bacterium]